MKLHGLMMLGLSGLALVVVQMTGCSPWSTYPSIETPMATKLTRPTFEPVPTVMAESIKYAREHYIKNEDLPVNLPVGANWKVYDAVFEKLGSGRHMTEVGEKALHITEVRTRGFDAQVDMIYPREDGLYQSVTLTLSRSVVDPFHVTTARQWQVRDLKSPEPTYIGPTPEEMEKIQKQEDKKRAKEAKEAAKEAEKAAKEAAEETSSEAPSAGGGAAGSGAGG
jgi:hypothetical protein